MWAYLIADMSVYISYSYSVLFHFFSTILKQKVTPEITSFFNLRIENTR